MAKIILGVDPSIVKSGVAVFSKDRGQPKIIHTQTIEPPKKTVDRFKYIADEAETIILKYKPDVLCIETQFMGRNAKTALDLAMVRGIYLGVFYAFRIEGIVKHVTPRGAKCAVGVTDIKLKGEDSKKAVQKMVGYMYPELKNKNTAEDVFDAVAIAIAGINYLMYE